MTDFTDFHEGSYDYAMSSDNSQGDCASASSQVMRDNLLRAPLKPVRETPLQIPKQRLGMIKKFKVYVKDENKRCRNEIEPEPPKKRGPYKKRHAKMERKRNETEAGREEADSMQPLDGSNEEK